MVVKSDGSIWFTDPNYGIMSDYEGHKADMEQDGCYVYRVDPKSGKITVVADDFDKPNGLAFSPDESTLYVADSGVSHDPEAPNHIRAFKVGKDGSLKGGKPFCMTKAGLPDGFRVDTDGNVWTSAGPAVEVFSAVRRCARPHQVSAERVQPDVRRAEAEPPVHHLHAPALFAAT